MDFIAGLAAHYPQIPILTIQRLARLYGTLARDLLGEARNLSELGERFGADLTGREVDYLMEHEWAQTVEDILWRRTKLGLVMAPEDVARLTRYCKEKQGASPRISRASA
jgi:glycerol-3-phosphate dehydrogenase